MFNNLTLVVVVVVVVIFYSMDFPFVMIGTIGFFIATKPRE
jgi:hypothetical protein